MLMTPFDSTDTCVRDIDSMARAVFTWVRQQAMEQRFLGIPITDSEQLELAAGFLAGMRARLGLGDSESSLVAYVYSLMRGDRAGALNAARFLLSRELGATVSCAGYLHGLDAARQLMNEQHVSDKRSNPAGSEDSTLSSRGSFTRNNLN
jgi:hypothetical protein